MSSLKPLVGPNIFQNLKPSLTFWTLDSPLSCFSNLLSVSLTVQPLVSLISTAIGRYFQSRCLLKMRFPFLPPLCLLSTLWVRDSAQCWDPNIMCALFYVLPVKYPVLYTSGQIKHSWSSLVHNHIWYTWKYEQLKGSLWGNRVRIYAATITWGLSQGKQFTWNGFYNFTLLCMPWRLLYLFSSEEYQ